MIVLLAVNIRKQFSEKRPGGIRSYPGSFKNKAADFSIEIVMSIDNWDLLKSILGSKYQKIFKLKKKCVHCKMIEDLCRIPIVIYPQ